MKKLTLLICVLAMLLGLAGGASASRPKLGPFSTTGYTTDYGGEILPSGHSKFHLTAQGGGEGPADDALCELIYGESCQEVCAELLGEPSCGVTDYFEGGTFSFEEWGIVDLGTGQGVNHGIMTVTTDDGEAVIQFGGQSLANVWGSFIVLDGTGEYKRLKGQGTYTDSALPVFTVVYDPSGTGPCYASGGDLKLKKKEAKWKLTNNGDHKITISSITINWPDSSGQLKKVKLGKKTIYDQAPCSTSLGFPSSCWATIDSDWKGKDKDRQIGKGKTRELKFEFQDNVSTEASDYTILVEFAEGCAVTAVAFPPAP